MVEAAERLRLGDVEGARRAATALAARSTRGAGDLRSSLIEAYVRTAELEQAYGQARMAARP